MERSRVRNRPRFGVLVAVIAVSLLALLSAPATALQTATPVAFPVAASPLPPAWLAFGPGGQLFARVIVAGACPAISLDGVNAPMTRRAETAPAFPVVACEAVVPFGVTAASIAGQALPIPAGPFTRIAVIGDTGCRLDDWGKEFQACNDPRAWPFAQVAASVAAWKPDLIIHVGDYLYRESPCPEGDAGCAGSPFGDTWDTWNADFFTPAASLLGSAPWVFMRGNHETCERNAKGWFAYLDPRPFQDACQRFTDPYVAPLNGLTLAVIDSAEAADTKESSEETAEYAREFAQLAEMARAGSWLVTHRPVWGILSGKSGEFEVDNATYTAATGNALGADYGLVLSGHIHLSEALAFAPGSGRPLQIIGGNSGTALDQIPTASPTAGQLGDPEVATAETLSSFGFLTLEPDGHAWKATPRDVSGTPLLACTMVLPEMGCAAP
ncbi:MAG: metallophosphoesterase [Thermomicrobiales bacterium]|nr:metallophosphoesterase [Thermomicrobiales bacterium]